MVTTRLICFGRPRTVETAAPGMGDPAPSAVHGCPVCPSVDEAAALAPPTAAWDSHEHSFASSSYMQRFSSTQVAGAASHSARNNPPACSLTPAGTSLRASLSSANHDTELDGPARAGRESSWVSRSFVRSMRGVDAMLGRMRRRRAAEDGTGASQQMDCTLSSINLREDEVHYTPSASPDGASCDRTTASSARPLTTSYQDTVQMPVLQSLPSVVLSLCSLSTDLVPPSVPMAPSPSQPPPVPSSLPVSRRPPAAHDEPEPQPSCCPWLMCYSAKAVSRRHRHPQRRASADDETNRKLAEMREIAQTILAAAAAAQQAATAAAAAAQSAETQYRALMATGYLRPGGACAPPPTLQRPPSPQSSHSTMSGVIQEDLAPHLAYPIMSGGPSPTRYRRRDVQPGLAGSAQSPATAAILEAAKGMVGRQSVQLVEESIVAYHPPPSQELPVGHQLHPVLVSGGNPNTTDTSTPSPSSKGLFSRSTSAGRVDLYRGLEGRLRNQGGAGGSGGAGMVSSRTRPSSSLALAGGTSSATISVATPTRRGQRFTLAANSNLMGTSMQAVGSQVLDAPLHSTSSAPLAALESCDYSFNRRCSMDVYDWDTNFQAEGELSSTVVGTSVDGRDQRDASSRGSSMQPGRFTGFDCSPSAINNFVCVCQQSTTPLPESTARPVTRGQEVLRGGQPGARGLEAPARPTTSSVHPQRLTASLLSQFASGLTTMDPRLTQAYPGQLPRDSSLGLSSHIDREAGGNGRVGTGMPSAAPGRPEAAPTWSPMQRLAHAGRSFNPRALLRNMSVSSSGAAAAPAGPALVVSSSRGLSFTHNPSRFCDVPAGRSGNLGTILPPFPCSSRSAEVPSWPLLVATSPGAGSAPSAGAAEGGVPGLFRRGAWSEVASCQTRALYSRTSDSGSLPCNSSLVRSDTAGSDGLSFQASTSVLS